MHLTTPLDYLPSPREYFNAEVGDYVDPDEVFVLDCEDVGPTRIPNPTQSYGSRSPGTYADISEIKTEVNKALVRFGITPGRVLVAFSTGGANRAGFCAYNRRTGETRIRLNPVAWSVFAPEERRNTVLHESAHAIEFILYGKSDHGPRWRSIAQTLGCTGDRCLSLDQTTRVRAAMAKKRGLPPPTPPSGETYGSFNVGDLVRFPVGGGGHAVGTIVKKSRVRAQIHVSGYGSYRVPYGILSRAGAAPQPTPAPFVPRPVTPRPPQYLHMLQMSSGGTARSTVRFPTYDAAREALSDFVTSTENASGLRVIEASILVEESNAPRRVVKTFRRKT
jgi:hypothetical protein